MARLVLGLDIGGANLKAATPDGRAVSLPFALYKQPNLLGQRLAELLAHFPGVSEFAVTMTGELCDCFATKREGVTHILNAVRGVARSYAVRVWGTDGRFHDCPAAEADPLTVAAANWHALATWCGPLCATGTAILLDIGSTTTDAIALLDGEPRPEGRTDRDRLGTQELVYTGVRRTPLCAVLERGKHAAELFATTLDVYLTLGDVPENPADLDTADGRPATKAFAHARLSRMLGGDPEVTPPLDTFYLANAAYAEQCDLLERALGRRWDYLNRALRRQPLDPCGPTVILSGSGEFLARKVFAAREHFDLDIVSLADHLGPAVAACAPAYAVAVLATESPA